MTTRTCTYTGKEAKGKDSVLPKSRLNTENHNWNNSTPVNTDYQALKGDRLPTELEMLANETFHLLELARLRVVFFENKLAEIQAEINKDYKEPIKKPVAKTEKVKIKEKQIETAVVEKTVVESLTKKMDEILKPKKNIWDDDEDSDDQ